MQTQAAKVGGHQPQPHIAGALYHYYYYFLIASLQATAKVYHLATLSSLSD